MVIVGAGQQGNCYVNEMDVTELGCRVNKPLLCSSALLPSELVGEGERGGGVNY